MLKLNRTKKAILYIMLLVTLYAVPDIYCGIKALSEEHFADTDLEELITKSKIEKYNVEYDGDFAIDKNNVLWYYKGGSTDVVIPDRVKVIGRSVFVNHDEIANIKLPEGLLGIEDYAFSGCTRLRKIKIPDSVEDIGTCVFSDCTRLERISIGSGVKQLGHMCFWTCDNLKGIDVSESNTVFASYKGVLYDKSYNVLIKCPQGFEGKFVAFKKVGKICEYAFSGCSKLEKISFNHNIEYIGEAAFFNCCSLIKVELGENLHYIGSCAFSECVLLDNVKIPKTIEYIGSSAFYGCRSLRNVIIKSKDVEIDSHAFKGCHKDLVLYGCDRSTVQNYANKGKLKFNTISE